MDLSTLARDLDKLASADAVVADSYVRYALRKAALYFLASLLAVIGLVLLGLALYWLLEETVGPAGAAALVGLLGCLLAAMIAVLAILQRPGRDFSLAMRMRKSSLERLEQNIGTPSAGAYLLPAGEALVSSVLLPLIGVLIASLKSAHAKKEENRTDIAEVVDTPAASQVSKA